MSDSGQRFYKPLFSDSYNDHGLIVCDMTYQILPEAEIYFQAVRNSSDIINGMKFAIKNDIDIVNFSANYGNYVPIPNCSLPELYRQAVDKNIILLTSAGNDGDLDAELKLPARKDTWISVGAVRLDWGGKIVREGYSSTGDKLEIMSLSRLVVTSFDNKEKVFSGTSCSSPVALGTIGLMLSQLNYKPTKDVLRRIIYAHCLDMDIVGWDRRTGFGLFIPPKPNTEIKILPKFNVNFEVKRLNNNSLQFNMDSPEWDYTKYRIDIREMAENKEKSVEYQITKPYSEGASFIWGNAKDKNTYEVVCHAESKLNEYQGKYMVFGNTDKNEIAEFKGLGMEIENVFNSRNVIIKVVPDGGSNVIYALQWRRKGDWAYSILDASNPYQASPEFVVRIPFPSGDVEFVVHGIDVANGEMVYHGVYKVYYV